MEKKAYNPNIISITDITGWLYCPRKLYIQKVKNIRQPLTREMQAGKMRHNILEFFSKREKELVTGIDKDLDKIDLVFLYENFIKEIANNVFIENTKAVEGFRIDKEEFMKKLMKNFLEDIKLRVTSIKEKLKEGLFKENLWNSLDTVYISELSLESENLGLRGRVDRVEIQKKENKIIPYELKTRDEKIYPSDEIQLTAYAMLLEDYYKIKIPRGIVESGSLKKEIPITEENKSQVFKIADEIRNLNKALVPPMLSNFNKCKSCMFNEFCAGIS